MIGSAGYALTEMKDDIWWLVIPLALTTILSAHEVWRLMEDTLQIKAVPSMGNEPTALTAEHILAQDEALIRQGNLLSMQTRINDIREINIAKGNAINRARKAIVVIPMIAIALAVFLVAIERVPAYLPYVCRLWAGYRNRYRLRLGPRFYIHTINQLSLSSFQKTLAYPSEEVEWV